jgi:hypothetical protein
MVLECRKRCNILKTVDSLPCRSAISPHWDSENLCSCCRIDYLGTLRWPAESSCVHDVHLICHIPIRDLVLFGCQIVRIGCESHIFHWVRLTIDTMTAMMDTLSDLDTDSCCSHNRLHILLLTFNRMNNSHCISGDSKGEGNTIGWALGMASECIWITAKEEPHSTWHCTAYNTLCVTTAIDHQLASEEASWTICLEVRDCMGLHRETFEGITNYV